MESRSDESTWIERAREGSTDAFRMLVDRHRDRAYGLALRITGSAEEAEEVAQDAFVRVWRALPEFRGEASFGTWLHTIVARLALDRAAIAKTRARRETALEAAGDPPAAGFFADGGDPLLEGRRGRMLEDLSPIQRAVVVLYHLEDRPVLEVATVLSLP